MTNSDLLNKYNIVIVVILIVIISYIIYYIFNNIRNNIRNTSNIDEIIVCSPVDSYNNFVFIITRHVNSEATNDYWNESYKSIRKLYPDIKIIIIDDNSNYNFVSSHNEMYNFEIIQSEYPGRGELLPYYYFYKNKFAEKAIIIHDSIFLREKIFISKIKNVKFLWNHDHQFNNIDAEKKLIKNLDNADKLLELYDRKKDWSICVGVMSVITHDFLSKIQEKYNFFILLHFIKTRSDRMCLERIFGLLCFALNPYLKEYPALFGIQHESGYSYKTYLNDIKTNRINMFKTKKKIVKVWTGR